MEPLRIRSNRKPRIPGTTELWWIMAGTRSHSPPSCSRFFTSQVGPISQGIVMLDRGIHSTPVPLTDTEARESIASCAPVVAFNCIQILADLSNLIPAISTSRGIGVVLPKGSPAPLFVDAWMSRTPKGGMRVISPRRRYACLFPPETRFLQVEALPEKGFDAHVADIWLEHPELALLITAGWVFVIEISQNQVLPLECY